MFLGIRRSKNNSSKNWRVLRTLVSMAQLQVSSFDRTCRVQVLVDDVPDEPCWIGKVGARRWVGLSTSKCPTPAGPRHLTGNLLEGVQTPPFFIIFQACQVVFLRNHPNYEVTLVVSELSRFSASPAPASLSLGRGHCKARDAACNTNAGPKVSNLEVW